MINDRQKSSRAVEASVETHGARVAEALAGLFSPYLREGETSPDVLLLLTLAGRHLGALRSRLAVTDQSHLDELAKDAEPRRLRDESAERLREKMRGLRDSMGGIFGAERLLELAGIETPHKDPVALAAQIKRVMDRLSDPGLQLADPRFPGIRVEPQSIYEQLRSDYEQLTAALADLALAARQTEVTLIAKRRALDAYEKGFSCLASAFEALYSLAGETEMADRVRPSRRRPGQTANHAGEPPEVGEPPATSPSTASELVN